jgi:hypothetical protein
MHRAERVADGLPRCHHRSVYWKSRPTGRTLASLRAIAVMAALDSLAGCDTQVLRLLPEADAGARPMGSGGAPPSSTGCARDGQCSAPLSRCNIASGRCVQCTSASDCDSMESCDPGSGRCTVPCNEDRDCRLASSSSADYCDARRGYCVECFSNDDCGAQRRSPFCDSQTGRCVECLDSGDCGASDQACDPDLHYCVFG